MEYELNLNKGNEYQEKLKELIIATRDKVEFKKLTIYPRVPSIFFTTMHFGLGTIIVYDDLFFTIYSYDKNCDITLSTNMIIDCEKIDIVEENKNYFSFGFRIWFRDISIDVYF